MNLSGHSKYLFIQELVKMTACVSFKSHRLYLRISGSLTDDRAAKMMDSHFLSLYQVLFLYSNAASLNFLGNGTCVISFPSSFQMILFSHVAHRASHAL